MKNYPPYLESLVQNVFRVDNGVREAGTAFQIEVEESCYLVTAGHFAENLRAKLLVYCQTETEIRSCQEKYWRDAREPVLVERKAQLRDPTDDGSDIAFLGLAPNSIRVTPFRFLSAEPFVGQEALFLGFPLGLTLPPGGPGKRYPLPLMKRGIISGFNPYSHRMFLDGISVPGHSGGPVVVIEEQGPRIIGVVGGSVTNSIDASDTRSLNSQLAGHNPGITWATDLQWAIDSLSQKPSLWKQIDCMDQ